jgi:5-(carboxyamino)imidazole ribonucleotide synthase
MMRVAVIGGGQLARMMALDGLRLGIQFSFLVEPDESTQCVDGLGEKIVWDLGELLNEPSEAAFRELFNALGRPTVITVEKEAVPVDLLGGLANLTEVHPNPDSVYQTQHRAREKQLLSRLAIPTASFKVADTFAEVRAAYNEFGLPLFIKAVESGYDGKNQWQIHSEADLESFERESPPGPVINRRALCVWRNRVLSSDRKFASPRHFNSFHCACAQSAGSNRAQCTGLYGTPI